MQVGSGSGIFFADTGTSGESKKSDESSFIFTSHVYCLLLVLVGLQLLLVFIHFHLAHLPFPSRLRGVAALLILCLRSAYHSLRKLLSRHSGQIHERKREKTFPASPPKPPRPRDARGRFLPRTGLLPKSPFIHLCYEGEIC